MYAVTSQHNRRRIGDQLDSVFASNSEGDVPRYIHPLLPCPPPSHTLLNEKNIVISEHNLHGVGEQLGSAFASNSEGDGPSYRYTSIASSLTPAH